MSGNSSGEKREWFIVWSSAVLTFIFTALVALMMIEAWEIDGFVWKTALWATVDRGYAIDLVVVVPAGLVTGWILLFIFDESKKIQSVTVPAFAAVFALVIWSNDLWFGSTVDWSAHWQFFVVSFIAGLVTGGFVEYLNHRRREFPRAGWLLYVSVVLASLIGLVQMGVAGRLGFLNGGMYALSTAGLIFTLAVFVEYENDRSVTVVASSEKPRATLVGGLCKVIRDEDRNHRFKGEGAKKMIRALTTLEQEDADVLPDMSGVIEFRYKDSTSLISRWVSVTAEGVDTEYVDQQMDMEKPTQSGSLVGQVSLVKKPFVMLLPPMFQKVLRNGEEGSLAERMDRSDMVLVTVSFPELDSDDPEDLESVRTVEKILRRYHNADRPETVIVVTEAEKGLDKYEETEGTRPMLNEGMLEDYIQMEMLDDYHSTEIVTVSSEMNMNLAQGGLRWEEMSGLLDKMSG
jgi:hypothetical protein